LGTALLRRDSDSDSNSDDDNDEDDDEGDDDDGDYDGASPGRTSADEDAAVLAVVNLHLFGVVHHHQSAEAM
jgi:hypothetical protein